MRLTLYCAVGSAAKSGSPAASTAILWGFCFSDCYSPYILPGKNWALWLSAASQACNLAAQILNWVWVSDLGGNGLGACTFADSIVTILYYTICTVYCMYCTYSSFYVLYCMSCSYSSFYILYCIYCTYSLFYLLYCTYCTYTSFYVLYHIICTVL